MRTLILVLLTALALAGCQSAPKTGATAAGTPVLVTQITNQRTIFECPSCKMDFDGPGKCTMCNVDLVEMKVDYLCPTDNQPVEHAGKCPRCGADVQVVKTAMGQPPADTPKGN